MLNKRPPEFWHFSRPTLAAMAAHAAELESQGWDGMSLTDSQNLSPDVYVALSLAAQATSTLRIGPGVTNPRTRHSAAAASAIASIQVLSQGRAVLGFGRGDSSLFNIGYPPAPRALFESYLCEVQSYLRGDTIEQNGYPSQLRWIGAHSLPKVPVDMAATGPKVIAIGARHAERVSFAVGADPARAQWAVDELKNATPAGQPVASPGLYINVCVSDNLSEAAEMVRAGVGIFAHFSGMRGAMPEDQSLQDQSVFKAIASGYDKHRHGHPDATHAQALPIDFIQRFSVIGSPEVCIARLQALIAVGIERFFIIGPRPDHFGEQAQAASRRFSEQVMPALRRH